MEWGVLGPASLQVERRTRGLELGGAVRYYNEVAVPGMGGLWFAKPLFLSLLGIRIAEGSQVSNITAANAVEALACCLAFDRNKWERNNRLAGRRKLRGIEERTFKVLGRPGTYVTQPMRMATTSALPALGLVEPGSSRFNAMRLSERGRTFLEKASKDYRPHRSDLIDYLRSWREGREDRVNQGEALASALSPLQDISGEALAILREQIFGFDTDGARRQVARRCAIHQWFAVGTSADWASRPDCIDPEHWRDLEAGAGFFAMRDACLALLDEVERGIGSRSGHLDPATTLEQPIERALIDVRQRAGIFYDTPQTTADPNVASARDLAHVLFTRDAKDVLMALVAREGRALAMDGALIVPGPAFRGGTSGPADVPEDQGAGGLLTHELHGAQEGALRLPDLPEGISGRVGNFFWMIHDLKLWEGTAHG